MTYRSHRNVFLRALAAIVCAGLAASGCASSPPAEYAPVPGAIDTGAYPNLNIAPTAAATQFTTEERDAKLAALRVAGQQQSPGPAGETAEARRKRLQLINDQQSDTLKVIESQ